MVGYRRLRPLVAAGSGDCEGDSRHTCMAVAQVAQRNPRGLRGCDGLSAWRARACSPGYHISGFQPGGEMRCRPYRAVMLGGDDEPGPAARGIKSRAFSPTRQGSGGCDPGPAARGIKSRAFSPAGTGGIALTEPGLLLGMRSQAYSLGYHISGFQPDGEGKRAFPD